MYRLLVNLTIFCPILAFSASAATPKFSARNDYVAPGLWATVGDINRDGKLDVAVTTSTGFAVLLGNGDGAFQPAINRRSPKEARWIRSGDVNKDGVPDLVLVNNTAGVQSNLVYLYLGNGDGTFSGPTFPDLPYGEDVAIGDINGNGNPDIVNSGVNIVLGYGKGQFGPPTYYAVESAPLGTLEIFLVSLRNNGRLDIIEDNGVFVSVLLNEGKGKFEDGETIPVPPGAGCSAAADYNGDGNPDLAITTSSGISILLGTGKAVAPFGVTPGIPLSYAACLQTGDFNNDGIPDLLIPVNNPPPQSGGTITSYLGDGDGTFHQVAAIPTGTGGFLVTGDFNHDGKLDWAASGNFLAFGNGDGTFQTPVPYIPANAPQSFTPLMIASADLNQDGWTDLVLTDWEHDYICVLINNQQGGFTLTTYTQGVSSYGPFGIAFGDLNGDGALDMFVAFSLLQGGAVYLGDGNGNFSYGERLAIPVDTSGIPLIADLNDYGILDIAIACQSTTAVFLGKGGAQFRPPFYLGTGPEPGDARAMNLHGQSSGKPDLVYPDLTGLVYVLINQTK